MEGLIANGAAMRWNIGFTDSSKNPPSLRKKV